MNKYKIQARLHPTHWSAAMEKAKLVHYDNDYEVHLNEIDIQEIAR